MRGQAQALRLGRWQNATGVPGLYRLTCLHACWNLPGRKPAACFPASSLSVLILKNCPLRQLVFSSLAYQWCNDLDNALAEVGRILSANGLFLFATLGPDTLRELRDSWATVDHSPHVNTFYDMHDIGDALLRAGLENVVMDVETVSMRYPDCVSLMRDLKQVGAQNASLDRQPGLTGRKKLQALQQAYEAYRQAGTLPATYEIVYGHGWAPVSGQRIDKPGVARVPVAQIEKRRKWKNVP